MDEKWLVSAIITTHNRRDLLERAVNSVLIQTYKNLELIVIDDNSNDDTEGYCKKLIESNNSVTYIKISADETRGGNYARNKGIIAAKGELVAFLDDDDEWIPEKTEKQIKYLAMHPEVKAVSCNVKYIYDFKIGMYIDYSPLLYNKQKNDFFITSWLNTTSTIMVEKHSIVDIGLFDESIPALQECEMSYRLCLKYQVSLLNEALVNYYIFSSSGGQITSSLEKNDRAIEIIEKKFASELCKLTDEQKQRRQVVITQNRALRCLKSNKRQEYRQIVKPILKDLTKWNHCEYYLSFFMKYERIIAIKCSIKKWRS